MIRRLAVASCLLAFAACPDFTLAPRSDPGGPPAVKVTVTPEAAFAGQRLTLTFDRPVELARLAVTLGGRALGAPDESGHLELPFLESACSQELSLLVTSPAATFQPAVVRYRGAGHPGRPRPALAGQRRVPFVPNQLRGYSNLGVPILVASANGSAVVELTGALVTQAVRHVPDFVIGLEIVPHTRGAIYTGQYGTVGMLSLELPARSLAGGPSDVPVADAERSLPSLVLDRGATFAAFSEVNGGTRNAAVDALLVGPAGKDGKGANVLAHSDITLASTSLVIGAVDAASPLAALSAESTQAAPGSALWKFALLHDREFWRVQPTGKREVVSLGAPEAGVSVTPVALRRAPGDLVWAGALRLTAADGKITHSLLVARADATSASEPLTVGKLLAVPHAVADLEVLQGKSYTHLFVADGEQPFVWHYTYLRGVLPDEKELSLREVLQVGGIARRLSAMDGVTGAELGELVVADASGVLQAFSISDFGNASTLAVRRLALGLNAVAPETDESCRAPSLVVASRELSSVVVAATRVGVPPRFLQAVGTSAVELITLTDASGPQDLFVSAGVEGVVLQETLAQARAHSRPVLRLGYSFPATSLIALRGATDTVLVAGGKRGLAVLRPKLGAPNPVREPDELYPDCAGVVQLARAGTQVVALAKSPAGTRLCRYDPLAKKLSTGPLLPAAFEVKSLAVASDLEGGARAFLSGLDGDGALLLLSTPVATLESAVPARFADDARTVARLPTGGAIPGALGVSPDGRRLLIGFSGIQPGVVSLDPAPFLKAGGCSDTTRAGCGEQGGADSVTTLPFAAAPVGFAVSADGARMTAVLEDDTLAAIE